MLRTMGVSWTEKTKEDILQEVRPNISLEFMTIMPKMRYFGHVMMAHQSLEKDLMLVIRKENGRKGCPVCGGWTTSKV